MSIKTTPTTEIILDTTEIVTDVATEISADTSNHTVDTLPPKEITAVKKEYSIVGDSFYINIASGDAPTWLTDLIESTVEASVDAGLVDYDTLVQDVRNAIASIDVAANTYVEELQFNAFLGVHIGQHLATLNTTVGQHTAQIVDLDVVVAGNDLAMATRVTDLNATLSADISSQITTVNSTVAALDSSTAISLNALTTAFEDQESNLSGVASAVTGLHTQVGLIDGTGTPDGTGILSRLLVVEKQTDGVIETVSDEYDVILNPQNPLTAELITGAEPYAGWWSDDNTAGNEDVRLAHIGDVYIKYSTASNGTKEYIASYKFIKTVVDSTGPYYSTDAEGFTWSVIIDQAAQDAYEQALNAYDLADNKRRVFTTTPFAPYDVGDLWSEGPTGELNICVTPKLLGESYSAPDWELATKYTDDALVEGFLIDGNTKLDLDKAYVGTTSFSSYVASEIDKEVVVFSGTDKTAQTGMKTNDIYIESTTATGNSGVATDVINTYKYNGTDWVQINSNDNITALADLSDGKRTIYSGNSLPVEDITNPFRDNDLFFPSATFTDVIEYVENEIYRYSGSSWVKATRYDAITDNLSNQVDSKVDTYFGGATPPFSDSTSVPSDFRCGDYWYCDVDGAYSQGRVYEYIESPNAALFDYTWTVSSDISRNAFDLADGKRTIYGNAANNAPNVTDEKIKLDDLWIPSSTSGAYTVGKIYKCTDTATPTWIEVDYTNDDIVIGIQDGSIPLDASTITIGATDTTLVSYIASEADKRIHVYSGTVAPADGLPTGVEDNDIYIWNTTDIKSVSGSNVTYDVVYTYKYNSGLGAGLKWVSITTNNNITALSDVADGKRTIYGNVSNDVPAGEVNDIWIPTTGSDDLTYIPSELYQYNGGWFLATKYTDDTRVVLLETGLSDGTVSIDLSTATIDGTTLLTAYVADELDGVVTVFSGSDVDAETGMETNDLYVETTLSTATNGVTYDVVKVYKYGASSWTEQTGSTGNIAALRDLTDGKRTIFNTAAPTGMIERDMWIPNVAPTDTTKIVGEVYIYVGTVWVLATKYTENLDAFVGEVNPKVATLQNQTDGKLEYYFFDVVLSLEAAELDNIKATYLTAEVVEAANGNIAYNRTTDNGYWYSSSTDSWSVIEQTDVLKSLKVAETAQGAADGKISSFYAWSGATAPANYDVVVSEAEYDTDADGNYLDVGGAITNSPAQYVEIVAEVVETVAAGFVSFWFTGGVLYRKVTGWGDKEPVPEVSGNGTFIALGDILSVLDPLTGDTTEYRFDGSIWNITGAAAVVSRSKWFVDLNNAVNNKHGHVAASINDLAVSSRTYADASSLSVENKFAYDSTVILGGSYYKSGFGLDSSGITQVNDGLTEGTAFDSEFWVSAKTFSIVNPEHPTVKAVFKVTGTGLSSSIVLREENTEATKTTPKGLHDYYAVYDSGDLVASEGSSYISLQDVPAETSIADGDYWTTLSEKGVDGGYTDFLFTRKATTPADPGGADTWYTDVSSVSAGAGDLWSIKDVVGEGGQSSVYSDKRIIDYPLIREIFIYSVPTTGAAPTLPTSTYNLATSVLTVGSTGWAVGVPSITADNQKVYASTALVTGNSTQTSVSVSWSTAIVYSHRVDGISPDALTVVASKVGDATTLTFSNGEVATVVDGGVGDASGITIIYSDDAAGTNTSFTQGTKRYANYYEWTVSAPVSIPSGLTYTLFVGENGDSAGVLPIYADNTAGLNATFTYISQEYVNFYDWSVTAPTTVPSGLTYVKFVGEDGTDGVNANILKKGAAELSSNAYGFYSRLVGTVGVDLSAGDVLTVSADLKIDSDAKTAEAQSRLYIYNTPWTASGSVGSVSLSYERLSATMTVPADAASGTPIYVNVYHYPSNITTGLAFAKNIKVEHGSAATAYVNAAVDGAEGPRGTAVLSYSADLNSLSTAAAASDCGTYWNSAASSNYDTEIAGDTLVVTNTDTVNGWTHIYEYTGSSWSAQGTFTVNGNQVVKGTIASSALVSDIIIGKNATFSGTLNVKSATSGSRLVIGSDSIEVWDGNVLRVKLGNLA